MRYQNNKSTKIHYTALAKLLYDGSFPSIDLVEVTFTEGSVSSLQFLLSNRYSRACLSRSDSISCSATNAL